MPSYSSTHTKQELWNKAVSKMEEKFRKIQPIPGIKFIELNPSQKKFVCDLSNETLQPVGFNGSYGGGKSLALVFKLLVSASIPNNNVIVFRKFQKDLIDTTYSLTFKPIMESMGGYRKLLLDPRNNARTILSNGTTIFWRGLFSSKTGASGEPTRLGSTEYGAVFVDEAQEIDDEKPILALMGRLRWPPGRGFYHISMSFNPPEGNAWLSTWQRDSKITTYEAPIYENKKNLPPEYIDRMIKNYPKSWQKKFLEGKIGTIPKGIPAYKFNSNHFKKFKYNPDLPLVRGWDFGSGQAVCVIGQFDNSPRLCILDLIILQDSWTRPLCQAVKQLCVSKYAGSFSKINLDFVDGHDDGKTSRSALKNSDILIQEGFTPIPIIVRHDVRIQRINDALERYVDNAPFIVLNEDVPELCMALSEGYCVDGKGKISKDKYYEHIGDAFTFLFMGLMSTVSGPDVMKIAYRNFEDDLDYLTTRDNNKIKEAWAEDENLQLQMPGGF